MFGVTWNVAQIVGNQNRASERADPDGGNKSGQCDFHGLDVGGPHDRDDSKEYENEEFTESGISIWS